MSFCMHYCALTVKAIPDDQSLSHCFLRPQTDRETGNWQHLLPWLIKILCSVWHWVPVSLIKGAGLFFIQQAAKLQWAWSHTKGLCIVLFDCGNDPNSGNNGENILTECKKSKLKEWLHTHSKYVWGIWSTENYIIKSCWRKINVSVAITTRRNGNDPIVLKLNL